MKAVFAYLNSESIEGIVAALRGAGMTQLTVVSVSGSLWPMTPSSRAHLPQLGGSTFGDVKLEVICQDTDVARVVDVIRAHAGSLNDGTARAYVLPLDAVIGLHAPE